MLPARRRPDGVGRLFRLLSRAISSHSAALSFLSRAFSSKDCAGSAASFSKPSLQTSRVNLAKSQGNHEVSW